MTLKGIALSALLAGSAMPAQAVCTQANIAGTWTVTALAHLSTGEIGWNSCKLIINAAGKFTASTSGCSESDNISTTASGAIKLINAAQCAYDGTITFPGTGVTRTIRLATLSLDHQVVSGVVGGTGYGPGAILTMIKIK